MEINEIIEQAYALEADIAAASQSLQNATLMYRKAISQIHSDMQERFQSYITAHPEIPEESMQIKFIQSGNLIPGRTLETTQSGLYVITVGKPWNDPYSDSLPHYPRIVTSKWQDLQLYFPLEVVVQRYFLSFSDARNQQVIDFYGFKEDFDPVRELVTGRVLDNSHSES